jgi:exodeoxyribonuclease-5
MQNGTAPHVSPRPEVIREEDLSEDQKPPYWAVWAWVESGGKKVVPGQQDPMVLTLGGFAGTGKSTLVATLARRVMNSKKIAFCALTGKAAGVLRRKLEVAGVELGVWHTCTTIHSLLYHAKEDPLTGIVRWTKKTMLDCDLIIVDEASMVPEPVFKDLQSFDIPILAVGDHGQLPPVKGNFNLMQHPLLKLERIHRQAAGNPIIRLSARIRDPGFDIREALADLADGKHIRLVPKEQLKTELTRMFKGKEPKQLFDQAVLVYTNKLRCWVNNAVRDIRHQDLRPMPKKGEQVICLRNSNVAGPDSPRVFNGMRAYCDTGPAIVKSNDHLVLSRLVFPEEELSVDVQMSKYQFGQEKTFGSVQDFVPFGFQPSNWGMCGLLFDYGYALTVHKAQGSQFSDVLLCFERPRFVEPEDFRRWMYTAVTRSADRLTVVFGRDG